MITILTIIIVFQFAIIVIMYRNIKRIIQAEREELASIGVISGKDAERFLNNRREKIAPKPNPKPKK